MSKVIICKLFHVLFIYVWRCLASWITMMNIGQWAHIRANDKTTDITFSFLSMCGYVLMIHKCLSLIETSLQHLDMMFV